MTNCSQLLTKGKQLKKLSILATVAFAMAITTSAMAQSFGGNGISFFGNVARSDHNTGFVTVTGILSEPDIIIHIVDGYFDTTCTITSANQVYQVKLNANGGGLSLYPHTCYNTRTNAPVPVQKGAVINFDWHYSNGQGDWNLAAQQMNLMLPGFCDYDGFTGVGTVVQFE